VSSPTPGKWYDVVVVKGPGKLTYGAVQANGQGVVGVAIIVVDGVVVSSVTFDGANVHPRPHNDPTQEVYDAAAAGTAVIGQYTPPEALAFKSDVTVRMRITRAAHPDHVRRGGPDRGLPAVRDRARASQGT
jgi:hypothetical protein